MSFYEVGEEIESLKNISSLIEQSLKDRPSAVEYEEIIDAFQVELIPEQIFKIEAGKLVSEFDRSSVPRVFLTGGLTHGREPFPDNRRYNAYSGTVWLQNNVGDKLEWYYMETGSGRGTRNLEYPNYARNRSAHYEGRNTHVCRYGWRGKWYGGHTSASSWGRFVDEHGSGWAIKWHAGESDCCQ